MTTLPGNRVCRVLVIDDNAAIHEDFRKILIEISPAQATLRGLHSALFGSQPAARLGTTFEIDCASQGQEGLALARRALADGRPYSLAFIDLRMPPGWDGVETVSHLWKEQSDLQVVLCTAYSDYAWEEIRQALGETDSMVILKKPFDNVEVLQLAHALTRKWDLNRQIQYRVEDLDRLVRERTEQTRRALALFEACIAQSPSGILIAEGPEVAIRWANAAALSILGETDRLHQGIEVNLPAERWQMFRADGSPYPAQESPLFRAVLKGEISRNEEVIVRPAHGETRWISVNAAPIRGSDGAVVAGIIILQDVSERKRMELEKEKLQAQFVQAQKMESVGRLAGGVAHDFNNMLQAILGNVELALDDAPAPSRLQEELFEIQKAARRSTDLTRQLLAFARRQTISPRVLDLNDTVSGMLKMLQRLIGENIQLVWQPGTNLWPVLMDPSQIDQILANLTVNARDAITSTGKVTIETANAVLDTAVVRHHTGWRAGEYVALSVSDTGCGMDTEIRGHLFEPFFTTKGVGKGTGLGLATVFGIVHQNGGFIDVVSAPGHGTSVKIHFPRSEAPAEPAVAPPAHRPPRGTETVLLVEDEPQVLHLGRRILLQYGYRVVSAPSPEAALSLAAEHADPIHLLVTDVIMPGMNGKALRDRLRISHPKLKCLFMSGYPSDAIAHHGVLDEGLHFLPKPFTVHSLTEKVREALDSSVAS